MHRQPQIDLEIADLLQFRPKWWWDPIPPFLENISDRLGLDLTRIQLQKRQAMLQAELEAISQTLKAIEKG